MRSIITQPPVEDAEASPGATPSDDGRTASDIASRYSYQVPYVPDIDAFLAAVIDKTVVPYQVEVQPGRIGGSKLCWLSCPYCYGGSSKPTAEHISPDRYVELIRQTVTGPHGGVHKIIFAGYATDPLNYEYIEDLVEAAQENGQVTGFNTKALRVSVRLVRLLVDPGVCETSYFNISVDAGSAETYNRVHNVDSKADIYSRVVENIRRITAARVETGAPRDISVSYLLTRVNNETIEVEKAIRDIRDAGAGLIRFTFPQVPRGQNGEAGTIIPSRDEAHAIFDRLQPLVEAMDSERTRVLLLDTDARFSVVPKRVLPCLARFIFPTFGYDGHLYHCSQSAAPQFRPLALGNLEERDFWDIFYDYDTESFWRTLHDEVYPKMARLDCRCDRKEQCVNTMFAQFALGGDG